MSNNARNYFEQDDSKKRLERRKDLLIRRINNLFGLQALNDGDFDAMNRVLLDAAKREVGQRW